MYKHRGGFPEGQSPIVLDTLSNAEYNINLTSNVKLNLPQWLRWLRHSAHRPRCLSGEPHSIPRSAGRFHVQIPGVHALRLISWAGKEGSTMSSIIYDCWLPLSYLMLSN